ncbi:MAG: hypothetical protein AB4911_13755 [Oscillochloridaceae bacterium umkhey_bin13]
MPVCAPRPLMISPTDTLSPAAGQQLLSAWQIPAGRPLIVLNGSTSAKLGPLYAQLRPLIQEGLAAWLVRNAAVAITGGTDAGIFALLGRGFAHYGQPAACIGVTVAACLRNATHPHGVALEPHHSHLLLTPGQYWGDETAAMYTLAAAYAPVAASLTVVIGGGPLTLNEVEYSVAQGRRVLAVTGSGGVADALVATVADPDSAEPRLRHLAKQVELYYIAANASPTSFSRLLDQLVSMPSSSSHNGSSERCAPSIHAAAVSA